MFRLVLAAASSTLLLSACGSAKIEADKHSQLTGEARTQAATATVKTMGSDQSMDKFFSDSRQLKNACIVGFHNHTIVNDNTANYKSSMDIASGPNMITRHTTTISYDFKPSPYYFQGYTDFAYDQLVGTLKAYGYNVIDSNAIVNAPSYMAKGEKGNTSTDKKPQYAGYFDLDAKGLRHYDGNGFSAVRLLSANDEWAGQFHKETGCELMVNATIDSYWKVKGADQVDGLNVLKMNTETQMKLDFYTPWAVWHKASKEIDKKIYGAVNRGGSTALKKGIFTDLLFTMGNNPGKQEIMDRVAVATDNAMKTNLATAVEFQVRAFHTDVYTKKTVPPTVPRSLASTPESSETVTE